MPAPPECCPPGPDGLRVLCIGGVPGGVYEPPEWSSSGAVTAYDLTSPSQPHRGIAVPNVTSAFSS